MKRILTALILEVMVLCLIIGAGVNAAQDPPIRPDTFTANYPVYDAARNENKVTLNWSVSAGADFYILEITSDLNWAGQTISEEKRIETGTTYLDLRQNIASNPSSGTVYRYKIFAATYIKDEFGNATSDFIKSTTFASVAVLTDPAAAAKALSTSAIKLTWDDIKYDGLSIDYEIVKYKKGINVGSEQIRAVDIGGSAKRVNGKLEYTVKDLDKSTEYTFQLKPILSASLIKFNPYVAVIGATNISAIIQRYNESIIKLMWDEYQGSIPASDLYYKVIEVSVEGSQKTYRTIATPQIPYYFIQISPGEEHLYLVEVRKKEDDVKVAESAEVSLKDMVIPATPEMHPLEYTVTNNRITVSWDAHTTANMARDMSVKYDVWLLTDPDSIDNVRTYYNNSSSGITDNRLGVDLQVQNGNISINPNFSVAKVNGIDKYSFVINNLTYNSIYYVGVVAKKTYIMQDPQNQNLIISTTYISEPAMATIKTASGNLEQPVALVKPLGISIETDAQGQAIVTKDSVAIKWPLGQTSGGIFTKFYQDDVYFKVGLEQYLSSFDKTKINDPSNANYNIQTQNVNITKGAQEATATITGLRGNTAYVIWVKAYRDIPDQPVITKISEASDPIIIVTLPDYTMPNAKPPVPTMSVVGNEYKDKLTVQVNTIAGMKYTIYWGKEDSLAKKTGQKEYSALSSLDPDSIVIDGLEPESTYYIWIMASNGTLNSEWSDSAIGLTIPIPPPDPPRGFGVKKVLQGVDWLPDIGERHITIQWDKEDNLIYIIEVSQKEDFSNCDTIELSNVSEYKIEKFMGNSLESNTRFWIRIFAKDEDTNKISQSSPYLTVKTKFNYDEYDSSKDKEVSAEEKVASEVIDGTVGTWTVSISEQNGERLIQKIRTKNTPDYNLDLSQTSVSGINKREVTIPYKVLEQLSDLSQNFIVKTTNIEFTFLPESISVENIKRIPGEDLILQIIVQSSSPYSSDNNEEYRTLSNIYTLEVTAKSSLEDKRIIDFNKPIKIKQNYVDDNYSGTIGAYNLYPGSDTWKRIDSVGFMENTKQYRIFLNQSTGKYSIKKQLPDNKQYGIVYGYKDEIEKLMSINLLKSVDSNNIKPKDYITLGDAVKILLDIAKTEYSENYMEMAKKAGLLSDIVNTLPKRQISRQEAVDMIMKLFEIRTGKALAQASISSYYIDRNEVGPNFENYVANAIKMNILIPSSSYIKPNDIMTRGETLALVNRLVELFSIIEGGE